jgi:hypothetical protein
MRFRFLLSILLASMVSSFSAYAEDNRPATARRPCPECVPAPIRPCDYGPCVRVRVVEEVNGIPQGVRPDMQAYLIQGKDLYAGFYLWSDSIYYSDSEGFLQVGPKNPEVTRLVYYKYLRIEKWGYEPKVVELVNESNYGFELPDITLTPLKVSPEIGNRCGGRAEFNGDTAKVPVSLYPTYALDRRTRVRVVGKFEIIGSSNVLYDAVDDMGTRVDSEVNPGNSCKAAQLVAKFSEQLVEGSILRVTVRVYASHGQSVGKHLSSQAGAYMIVGHPDEFYPFNTFEEEEKLKAHLKTGESLIPHPQS